MNYGKYIVVKEMGCLVAILFNSLISHDTFLHCYSKENIISGGFFRIGGDDIITFGKSISLSISPNDRDSEIINRILRDT